MGVFVKGAYGIVGFQPLMEQGFKLGKLNEQKETPKVMDAFFNRTL